jgi:DNA-binding MarR family transcriptional regulator
MAQTVTDLEADGFVTRRPDPSDGRRVLVELTEAGRQALQAERAQRDGWLARVIAEELSPAEQEVLERAVELLSRLAEG